METLMQMLQEKFIYNTIFIMDIVKFHKVMELVKNSDHEIMCLPPYSPFQNPIDQQSKVKLMNIISERAHLITLSDIDGYV